MSWDDHTDGGEQVISDRYGALPKPMEITDLASFMAGDPALHSMVSEVISGLEMDMIPAEVQLMIVEAMTPAVRRDIVAKMAGLEASVLMTFKDQIELVDTVLRRVVTRDGKKNTNGDDMGVTVKEAMNMSLKLTTTMVRDLPKIYTLDRIQRLEQALFTIVEKHLSPDHQQLVLIELERLEIEAARGKQ